MVQNTIKQNAVKFIKSRVEKSPLGPGSFGIVWDRLRSGSSRLNADRDRLGSFGIVSGSSRDRVGSSDVFGAYIAKSEPQRAENGSNEKTFAKK